MSKKQRKPLEDSLAEQFVYGGDSKSIQPLKSDLPQNSTKEKTIRVTLDLEESMHRKLSLLAARQGQKKVEIMRMLLAEALKDVED